MELGARMTSMKQVAWLMLAILVLCIPLLSFFLPVIFTAVTMTVCFYFYRIARRLSAYAKVRFLKGLSSR